MTIAFRAAAGLAAGTNATISWTLPTGHAQRDFLLAAVAYKQEGISITAPAGYLALPQHNQGSGQAAGIDTGSMGLGMYWKARGTTETNPSASMASAPNVRMAGMIALSTTQTVDNWNVGYVVGTDNASAVTTFQPTFSSGSNGDTTLTVRQNDWIVIVTGHKSDSATESAATMTLSGATISAFTERLPTNTTTTGGDGSMYIYTGTVTAITSGTEATATPVVNITTASTWSEGPVYVLRVREPDPNTAFVESWGMVQI